MTDYVYSICMFAPAALVPQAQAFGRSLIKSIDLGFEAELEKDEADWRGFVTPGRADYAGLVGAPVAMIVAALDPDAVDAGGAAWTEASVTALIAAMHMDVQGPGGLSGAAHFDAFAAANGLSRKDTAPL